jgi:hypothetical protein
VRIPAAGAGTDAGFAQTLAAIGETEALTCGGPGTCDAKDSPRTVCANGSVFALDCCGGGCDISFVPPPGGGGAEAFVLDAGVPHVPQNLWFCSSAAPHVMQAAMGATVSHEAWRGYRGRLALG